MFICRFCQVTRPTKLGARLALLACFAMAADAGAATDAPTSAAVKNEGGKYFDAKGNPTYKIGADGTVDWPTMSGYLRYNGTCNVCHGPDGSGSSFGPDLTNSLKTMSYSDFTTTVIAGRNNVSTSQDNVMPSFGDNKNVMCYLDNIYVYLRARADGALGGGRPGKNETKSKEATKAENDCMG